MIRLDNCSSRSTFQMQRLVDYSDIDVIIRLDVPLDPDAMGGSVVAVQHQVKPNAVHQPRITASFHRSLVVPFSPHFSTIRYSTYELIS